MSKVIVELTMSLDGFVAGPNDTPRLPLGEGGARLFDWYQGGDTPLALPGTDMVFHVSRASADLLRREWDTFGAMVTGRRLFDIAGAWGGRPPVDGPCFVVTHNIPEEWTGPHSPFSFVTDGVARAVARAIEAAGDKHVSISSANIMQQCIALGLLDEIRLTIVGVLLGAGVSLFEHLGTTPIPLERTEAVVAPDVTHLHYRIVK